MREFSSLDAAPGSDLSVKNKDRCGEEGGALTARLRGAGLQLSYDVKDPNALRNFEFLDKQATFFMNIY